MTDVTVTHAPDRSRYEATVDDRPGGFAAYRLSAGVVEFTHTEVDPAMEGRGVGSALARGALDDVRRTGGRRVVPSCPFIARWIEEHPEYADLLADPPTRD